MVTRGYSGSTRLQGVTDVTRADMGFLEVRGGYRGGQGVTRAYRWLQGVTRGYMK